MLINRKFELILIIFLSQYLLINAYFTNSPFIKDFTKIEDYENEFKTNKFKFGFMLIYSKYCGHCRHFAPNYIKLSELFHNELFFYALGSNSNYDKVFKITGFPTILFYSNEKYKEILFGRSISKISKFIREHILYNCTEISYKNIDLVYNEVFQKEDRNLLIGYFDKKSENMNIYTSISNNLKNDYIDLCYYCTDFNLLKKDKDDKYKELAIFRNIKENEVCSYSHKRENNTFIFNNKDIEINNIFNYEKFLFDNVINIYEEIQNKEDVNILDKMKNKPFLIFSYDSNDIKEKHIKIILDLYNITTNKNDSLYYYILLNKNIKDPKFKDIQKNEIYYTSSNLSEIIIIEDLEIIKEKILNNNFKNIDLNEIEENEDGNNIMDKTINSTNEKNINENTKKMNSNNFTKNISTGIDIINNLTNNISNNLDMVDIVKEKEIINNNISNNYNIIKTNFPINIDLFKNNSQYIIKKDNRRRINNRQFPKNNIINNNNNFKNKERIQKSIEEEITQEPNPNKIRNILIILVILAIIIYIIIKKFLCVGFIKVYDSQIIEFNQPNKIEII